MKLRRAAALFLSIALLFHLSAPTADAYSAPGVYSDVPTSHWAHDAIARWSEYGVINGYNGKFNPSGYLTRGEMAVILNNLLLYTGRAPNIFFDLDDSWYTDAILKCYAAGVMVGSGGYRRPGARSSREEAFCMIFRALDLEVSSPMPSKGSLNARFTDVSAVSPWAYDQVITMVDLGYVHGSNRRIAPKDNISRAEMVSLLDQVIALVIDDTDAHSGDNIGNVGVRTVQDAVLNDADSARKLGLAASSYYALTHMDNVICWKLVEIPRVEDGDVRIELDLPEPSPSVTPAPAPSGAPEPDSGDSVVQNGKIVYGKHTLDILPGVRKNTLKDSGFSTDKNGKITYSYNGFTAEQGVDVSSWQRQIDWKKVAADGITFAFIRVGYRGYVTGEICEDSWFETNIKGALAAGLKVGVYFFSQAISAKEAVEEAEFVLSKIRNYRVTLPVVFDWENISGSAARTDNLSKSVLNDCAAAFCSRIKQAKYEPCVYFGANKGLLSYDLSRLKDYTFWFARYESDTPRFYYGFSFWQYSSTGKVSGINGYADRDLCFVKY